MAYFGDPLHFYVERRSVDGEKAWEILAKTLNLSIAEAQWEAAQRVYPRDFLQWMHGARIMQKRLPSGETIHCG